MPGTLSFDEADYGGAAIAVICIGSEPNSSVLRGWTGYLDAEGSLAARAPNDVERSSRT
jgi:hypothetical protein